MFESKLHLAERISALQKTCTTYSDTLMQSAGDLPECGAKQSVLEIAELLKNVSL